MDSIDYFHLRCEKGLEGNRCLKYYNEEKGKKKYRRWYWLCGC